MSITITNIDNGQVALRDAVFEDATLAFPSALTYPAGTVLARDSGTDKMVALDPDDPGGVDHEIPKAVLTYPVTRASAGDVPIRALVGGVADASKLVDEDGTALTVALRDGLRGYGILSVDVNQLTNVDNPQP